MEDVETLCRKHHRIEHGFGPTDFAAKAEDVRLHFRYQRRASVSDWRELASLISCDRDVVEFGDVMFDYISHVIAMEQEGHWEWWMDEGRNQFWFRRAFNVRKSIKERINHHVRQAL